MESHPHHPKTIVRNGVITLEHYLALTDSHKTEDLTINHLNQLLDRNTCLLTDSHKTEDLTINHLNQICLSGCLVRRKMKYARSNSFPRSFQNLLPYRSRVLRDGKWSEQDAAILVSGDIISINDLGNSNLFGHLVPELGKLENLQYLELYKNNIQGTIPAELGNLKSLISLDLYSNNITGTMTILMVQYKAD